MNYIPASEIIRETKNDLSSYFERGLLDQSYLYPVIRTCLSKMGLKILPVRAEVIRIENFKGELPCSFYKLVLAVGCGAGIYTSEPDYLNTKLIEHEVCESDLINTCTTVCDVCSDSCENLFTIKQYFNTYSVEFKEFYPLCISNDARPYCTNECFQYQRRGNEITIKNGHLYTGFESGDVYLEYLTLTEENGELMIPDIQVIKDWIKMEMMFVCFRKLYLNGESDVQQRLGWVTQQLAIHQTNATSLYKSWTVKEFYDLRKTLYSRFHKYNTSVYGKYYHYPVSAKSIEERRRQSLGLYA